ncbi:MAG: segregation/condensation protein A [Candidatus Vogelbacteria bacterium]|nr:segregation/condensation protein A [Candidatus Vogelbacteria bacterium]
MENSFKVKAGEFEGPLELLLDLVEKRRLHISQVSLAQVADDYVAHLKSNSKIPMGEMANFILVASTLMFIKSLSLLPNLSLTEEEKGDIADLERRLRLYEQIRHLSVGIKERFGASPNFTQVVSPAREIIFAPSNQISLANLLTTAKSLIATLPKVEHLPQVVVKKMISLEEAIIDLSQRVSQALKLKFSDYIGGNKVERVNVIVSFLGMLELVKQGVVDVKQELNFAEIELETRSTKVPRYDL